MDPRRCPENELHGVPASLGNEPYLPGLSPARLRQLWPEGEERFRPVHPKAQPHQGVQTLVPTSASSKAGPSTAGTLWTGLRQGCETEAAPGGKDVQQQDRPAYIRGLPDVEERPGELRAPRDSLLSQYPSSLLGRGGSKGASSGTNPLVKPPLPPKLMDKW